ncbi:MAG: hypothetical protein J7L55_01705, partial [Desulfurococcales archaeon]|nr:hypothetical protein [Desulfurococcales archaeon]
RVRNAEEVLIIGCNFTSLVTSLNILHTHDVVVACAEHEGQRYLKNLAERGIKVLKASRVENNSFDSVIVSTGNPYYVMKSISYVRNGGSVIFLPQSGPTIPVTYSLRGKKVTLEVPTFTGVKEGEEALKILKVNDLKDHIATTSELEEIPTLSKFYGRVVWVR